MAWRRPEIGGVQAGSGWRRPDIGAVQAVAGAPPEEVGQVIMITKEEEQAIRFLLAGGCMAGQCTRRDFHKKVIQAAAIIGV